MNSFTRMVVVLTICFVAIFVGVEGDVWILHHIKDPIALTFLVIIWSLATSAIGAVFSVEVYFNSIGKNEK